MFIRNSENPHAFQLRLFSEMNIQSCQGLLMDKNHKFTAVIEACECQDPSELSLRPFSDDVMYCKLVFARELGVPFYMIYYSDQYFRIFEISERNGVLYYDTRSVFPEKDFAKWWGRLKQTSQNKLLNNGGENRIAKTIFDTVLRNYGFEWGGNIDGFMLTESKTHVKCIVDNISVSHGLANDEPGRYFNSSNPKHGPRYDGWYASVKCSHLLKVPHLLFTFDKKDPLKESIGLTIISNLTPQHIEFKDNICANQNVVSGLKNIKDAVNILCLTSFPPDFEDIYETS